MKTFVNLIAAMVAVIMILPATVFAGGRELTAQEKIQFGATHEVQVIPATMAASTTANMTYTNTFAIPAKASVAYVGMRLVTAFETTNAFTSSLAAQVGDPADSDYYQVSTELASDGTEIYSALPRESGYTILAGVIGGTNWMTNIVVASFGQKYYDVATNLVVTLTPDSDQSGSQFNQGDVRFYFKVIDPTKLY